MECHQAGCTLTIPGLSEVVAQCTPDVNIDRRAKVSFA